MGVLILGRSSLEFLKVDEGDELKVELWFELKPNFC
jgi:hypothetical protein